MKASRKSVNDEIVRRLPWLRDRFGMVIEDPSIEIFVRVADGNLIASEVCDTIGTEASGYTVHDRVEFYAREGGYLGSAGGGEYHHDADGQNTVGETVGDALARWTNDETQPPPYWIVRHIDESSDALGNDGQDLLTIYKPPMMVESRGYCLLLQTRASLAVNAVDSMMEINGNEEAQP